MAGGGGALSGEVTDRGGQRASVVGARYEGDRGIEPVVSDESS